MGQLVEGKWVQQDEIPTQKGGHFVRPKPYFHHKISDDGSSEFTPEPNRYHLYISYACPWACRTLIIRKLKGLEDIISYPPVDAFMENDGWSFGESGPETEDRINHKKHLHEIYTMSKKDFSGRVTVPVLWDKKTHQIVNNESADIIRILNEAFNDYAKINVDFYPEELRKEIDSINDFVYENINNGVYRCGFAKTQEAYNEAFDALFSALEKIEKRLSQQRYLVGTQITEADWRLFTTLVRFDPVYHVLFKCNLKRIIDYDNLQNYLLELYQVPGVKETVRMDHIKEHYYRSHDTINPRRIVPKGPELDLEKAYHRP